MTDTVAVLGLDGADYRLLNEWNCENILLDNHDRIETFANLADKPRTNEVWPVIATGQMPEHTGQPRGSDWTGPMSILNTLAGYVLSEKRRAKIGAFLRSGTSTYHRHDQSMFSDGVVWNWPGITPAENWAVGGYWWRELKAGGITNQQFEHNIKATTGQEVGWLLSLSNTGLPVVGVHAHVLDHAGHAWARHPERIREYYEHVDWLVGIIKDHFDTLIIVSDHGIQSTELDDDDPGSHSFRATVSSTEPGALPEHVADVREYVEGLKPERVSDDSGESTFDTTREQLRDLGYIND